MVLPILSALVFLPLLVLSHPTPNADGWDSVKRSLPLKWYQEPGHPVEKLFRRQNGSNPDDGLTYPAVGSPQWAQGYPAVPPDSTKMPQEWTNALNAAVAAGKIPNSPLAINNNNAISYPNGANPNDPSICSATFGCRGAGDIWDGPDGVLALSFDDGPIEGSNLLYDFLGPNHIPSTHFMIGSNILANPQLFIRAFSELHSDIAVHTWSHRYMTTLSNLDVVAEFGWTMEIIKNSTGGRLPRYWRPPYGDVDNRVRAIAKEVFGLTTVIWNHDTLDWSLTTGGTTPEAVNASLTQWLTGPKSPGLVILEHELTNQSSQSFIDAWPLMSSTGWKVTSVAQMQGLGVYLNSKDSASPVQKVDGVLGYQYTNLPTSTSSQAPPPSSTAPPPAPTNATSSTTQTDKNGSIQSIVSKFAGILGAVFLTVAFYA